MAIPASAPQVDDFDLQLRPTHAGAYEAAVLRSPAGEVRRTFTLPLPAAAIETQQQRLAAALRHPLDHDDAIASALGGMLFASVFAGGVLQAYDQSLGLARSHARDLRIRLRVLDDALLAALPWELLYDARHQAFVALQPDTILVRTLETLQPRKPLTGAAPLRVLAMAAQPSDLDALDVARERQHLEAALHRLGADAHLHWVEGQTWRDLHDALQRGTWHVVHFLGHGHFDRQTGSGFLAFADARGAADLRSGAELAQLLGGHDALRLVVLNACASGQGDSGHIDAGVAHHLVRAGVPAVLAMQYAITDAAATELAHSFYRALSNDLPIDAAFTEARHALRLAMPETLAWAVPVLVTRSADESARPALASRIERLTLPTAPVAVIIGILILIGVFVTAGIPIIAGHVASIGIALSATETPTPTATPSPTPTLTPTATPFVMTSDTFNIAVSEFEALDRAGNRVAAEDAHYIPRLISREIARNESLKQQIDDVYQMSMFVADAGNGLPKKDGDEAGVFAERVGAHVLVFGVLEQQSQNRWQVQPMFYIRGRHFLRVPELFDETALGKPIEYRVDNPASRGDLIAQIGDRIQALGYLLTGLVQYERDDASAYERATAAFEAILSETQWGKSAKHEGQEIVYLLAGNSYLIRADLAEQTGDMIQKEAMLREGEEHYRKGLAYNNQYAKIHGALGVAKWELLPKQQDCSQTEKDILHEVEYHLASALSILGETGQSVESVQLSAHLYLGRINLRRFYCSTAPENLQLAIEHFSKVIRMFGVVDRSFHLRLVARAHAEAGMTRWMAHASNLDNNLEINPDIAAFDIPGHFAAAVELAAEADLHSADEEAATEWIPYHLFALCHSQRINEIHLTLERDTQLFPNPEYMSATAINIYRTYPIPTECRDAINN